ncbi:hypothetical protein FRC00_008564 [Tulasnella sp. 408]|nr:hypothetical protein FRC00_008564 [Tulasnella sp. 408]
MSSSSSSSRTSKRVVASSSEPRPAKRLKLNSWAQITQHLTDLMEQARGASTLARNLLQDTRICDDLDLRLATINTAMTADPTNQDTLEALIAVLTQPLSLSGGHLDNYLLAFRAKTQDIADLIQAYRREAELRPAPNEFAKRSTWTQWQDKDKDAILCLRPAKRQGMLLTMMDDVFRTFKAQIRSNLPLEPQASLALRVANELCREMPQSLAETDRRRKFSKTTEPMFGTWTHEAGVESILEEHSGRVDACVLSNGLIVILREDRSDLGEGNDPHMQACRAYQLDVQDLAENVKMHGAPRFILTVQGPLLSIYGAFWDGRSVLVEPLTATLHMLPDLSQDRTTELAKALYALWQGAEQLKSRNYDSLPASPMHPGLPRVYKSFKTSEQKEVPITFTRPHPGTPLMFIATSAGYPDLLAKFAVNHPYGADVQTLLHKAGLAPRYYGRIEHDGNLTGHVMDYLPPPSEDSSGWITLHDFAKEKDFRRASESIGNALDTIISLLREGNVVHGDLRSNNIMIRVNSKRFAEEPVSLHVVDFDWAGKAGDSDVRYPLTLNSQIVWPGESGSPILQDHDDKMVKLWWPKLAP